MSQSFNTGGIYMEPQEGESYLLVDAYGDGGFRLKGERIEGSVLINADAYESVTAMTLADLTVAHFEPLRGAEQKPEVFLIGTGEKMGLLPAALRRELESRGIGYELMDTGAAARTYNVLRMEDRRIAALLIQID